MPFHLLPGDCIEQLRKLKSSTVGACITDPPYGMSDADPDLVPILTAWFKGEKYVHKQRGFMGREWDAFVPGPEIWKEVYRVLKPGAFLAAFCSTRTWDVMSLAIRLAGFECKDTIAQFGPSALAWTNGCLSEDTEILLDGRWEPYHRAKTGRNTLVFDPDTRVLSWQPIQEVFDYEYDNVAYHIKGEYTDQLVSRNHRCLVYKNDSYEFRFAEHLPSEIFVPVLQSVCDLQADFSSKSQSGQDLFGSVPQAVNVSQPNQTNCREKNGGQDLCDLCQANARATSMVTSPTTKRDFLFSAMFGGSPRRTMGEARIQSASHVVPGSRGIIQSQNVGEQQPRVERRGDLLQNAWELQGGEVCEVSGASDSNGTKGWVRDGTPSACGQSDGTASDAKRSGTSHEPRSHGQHTRQSCPVCHQPRPQEVRTYGTPTPDLARVTPVYYQGKVWCVRVPTGCFVARRNGQIFITGNSGFPKGGDLGRVIDKKKGIVRPVVGYGAKLGGGQNGATTLEGGKFAGQGEPEPILDMQDNEWAGFSNSLKPSWEVILIFRKPMSGTLMDNVQQWGTGGLNIDAARVETIAEYFPPPGVGSLFQSARYNNGDPQKTVEQAPRTAKGRWPTNIAFTHSEDCVRTGVTDENGEETQEQWACAEGCPVEVLAQQSGKSVSRAGEADSTPSEVSANNVTRVTKNLKTGAHYGDQGTATRFFPTFAVDPGQPFQYVPKVSQSDRNYGADDLYWARDPKKPSGVRQVDQKTFERLKPSQRLRGNIHVTVKPIALGVWLAKLLCPPGEIVLDPFTGSGSLGVGALKAGMRFVGCELDPDHCKVAVSRLQQAEKDYGKQAATPPPAPPKMEPPTEPFDDSF